MLHLLPLLRIKVPFSIPGDAKPSWGLAFRGSFGPRGSRHRLLLPPPKPFVPPLPQDRDLVGAGV